MPTIPKDSKASPKIVILPIAKINFLNLRDIYHYRHLLWSMVWKSIRLEFDQMVLGYLWVVARPLAMLFIFTFIKNKSRANFQVEIDYPLYFYAGIILWFYFRDSTMATAKSLMKDAAIMKRVYYPRLISPMVPGISNLFSLGITLLPLIMMMVGYGVYPGWRLIGLPVVIGQCLMLVWCVGLIFACLIAVRSDFERFLNLCLYLGLFVSPVIFAPEMIPEKARVVYFLNPMAGTLLAFRSCLFQTFPFPVWQFGYSIVTTVFLLFVGVRLYRRTEVYISDRL